MARHGGAATSAFYVRREPCGAPGQEVVYAIAGSVTRTGVGPYSHHPEDFDVEVVAAWRIDPLTSVHVPVAAKDWFTDDELQEIHEFLSSVFEHEVPNELDPTADQ